MQIMIDLPDNLPLTEADVRLELAIIGLDRHHSAHDWNIEVRSGIIFKFYGSGGRSHLQIDSGERGQVLGAMGFPLR